MVTSDMVAEMAKLRVMGKKGRIVESVGRNGGGGYQRIVGDEEMKVVGWEKNWVGDKGEGEGWVGKSELKVEDAVE